MFHGDPLTLFLAGLLLCLLWGECYEPLGVKRVLWGEGRAFSLRYEEWHRIIALLVALVALIVGQTGVIALSLAVMMVLLGGKAGDVFLPFWGVPALVLYGLFPTTGGTVLILPVLLWPGQGREISPYQRCVGVILALGLASHVMPSHPVTWILGSGSVMLLLGIWAYIKGWGALLSVILTLRPLLLLGIIEAAQQEGLDESAQAAVRALVLDLTLQVIGTLRPSWRSLSLPIPPLPGFLVMWLGMHAALGMATGTPGWTIAGVGLALILVGLSVVEGVRLIPALREPVKSKIFIVSAVVLPSLVFLASWAVLKQFGATFDRQSLGAILWFFPGGDGAVVAYPVLWVLLCFFWFLSTRRSSRRVLGDIFIAASVPLSEKQSWGLWFAGERPHLMWQWRRWMVGGRGYWDVLAGDVRRFNAPLSEVGLAFWLLFLGSVLAIIGLTA
ncbi:hypothetical protein GS501_06925 [Saccharibacter sp. 17.LH.SD]|uniref:hypothetical protein n=1 Tax=Saccharibacter sp. 17.LH.SD TaxID=2689393 RepID=UPI0013691F50|nr:hypothetical protein [Saccharibacter sp. 17.LH.SD]MXV44768.1 hypothetical protein [Saccharibacter sp. 17.LH.SD]